MFLDLSLTYTGPSGDIEDKQEFPGIRNASLLNKKSRLFVDYD